MTAFYRPKFISTFAGVGGFDLGLERAGFECVGQVEIHPFALAVLEKHWPAVPKHNDIRTAIDWWNSEPRPHVNLICGGFPCQDISLAKADRKGLDGDRSGLFFPAMEFVDAVRPDFVLLENVEGLLSSNNGRDLAAIQATLAELGYSYLEWRVLDSQFFGVPQRRVRVFIVASTGDTRLGPILLEPEGSGRDLEAVSKARQKVARAASKRDGAGVGDRVEAGTPADADGVREAAGLPGRVDHLGETARTLTTSGARQDGDTDSFVVAAPPVAATLTHGGHSDSVSAPGRRKEDDVNLVVTSNPCAEIPADPLGPGENRPVVEGTQDPAGTLTAHIGHAYSSPRGDGSDNLVVYSDLPVATLQGSINTEKTRGSRVDAEAAAGGHLIPTWRGPKDVISAITKNSASGVGPDDNEAQAGRLVVKGYGMHGTETARAVIKSDENQRMPGVVEPNLAVYAKYRNAQTSEDDEAWAPADVSRTLNVYENTDTRQPHAVLDSGIQPETGCGCCPVDPKPDANRYGTMGNAVSVPVIHWIGCRLYDEVALRSFVAHEDAA